GLTVMIVENNKLPRVSYNLTIDNVPVVEGSKAGVSSILGSMLGNGTTSIPKNDFNEEVDFLGANLNFGSSGGFASGLSKYAGRILELMADAAMNPLLVEEEFQKQKDIQLEGLKSNEKSVDAVAGRVGSALAYGVNHPYGEYVTEETLNAITLDDVKEFYTERFNPGQAYLVVIGDVKADDIRPKIEKTFGLWIKGTSLELSVPKAIPNAQYTQINFIDMPNAVQSNISLTHTTNLEMSDPDYHAVLIANKILGGGFNSYLNMNLREEHGYTYGARSSLGADKYVSRFRAGAAVRNMVTDSAVVETLKEIKRIKTEPVTEEALANAKAKYTGDFVLALERPQTLAQYALNIKINELPEDFYSTYLEKINAVTAEDVMRVANKYFKPENAKFVVVGKGSEVLENLEKTGIPVKFYDTYANEVERPEFSKPIPDGITAQTVLDSYIKAVGGKEKLKTVNTMHATADVTIEGVPMSLKADMKYMSPNKESMEMSVESMGVIMKQKFNGESGYGEQQGMKRPLTDDEVADKKAEQVLFPELYYNSDDISLEALTTIEGKDAYKLKISSNGKSTFRYYEAETGFLIQAEQETEAQGQKMTSVSKYSNYSEVDGVKFPYYISVKSGPQTILMNFTNVKINEAVTDADFD
ncbi:MAG: insulinase family protein, partial [Flavobacteriaceae bacterium]|nr:insulinase family protein [Flavobacteriaceae bacterium]